MSPGVGSSVGSIISSSSATKFKIFNNTNHCDEFEINHLEECFMRNFRHANN